MAAEFVRRFAESGRVKNAFTYGVLADRFEQGAAQIRSSLL